MGQLKDTGLANKKKAHINITYFTMEIFIKLTKKFKKDYPRREFPSGERTDTVCLVGI